MDCSDERIIDLIKTAGRKAEHQSVKCLLKCERQANAMLIKQGLQDADERRSVFYHAIVAFITNVRRGRFKLTGKAKICTYLTETSRRQWLKRYAQEHKPREGNSLPTESGDTDYREALKIKLSAALEELSATDKEIIVAFYFYGEDLKAYAERRQIAYNTAKKRISRARERLKEILKPTQQ